MSEKIPPLNKILESIPDEEADPTQKSFDEAWDRLYETNPKEFEYLMTMTCGEKDTEKILEYAKQNEKNLSEEGKYFLQMTYYNRTKKPKN